MNQISKLCMLLFVFIVFSGCMTMTMQTNTQPFIVQDSDIPLLNSKESVMLENVSLKSGDIIIGKWTGWEVKGDLHKFTDAAIGTAKDILERQNIKVEKYANKILELSVFDAKSEQGWVMFSVTTKLRVRTGNDLVKEYVEIINHGNGYGTTATIEKALANCVLQMLKDDDIKSYLEN